MKKILISLFILMVATVAFGKAQNYQYSIVVFPANVDESITFEDAPYKIAEGVSRAINKASSTCSLAYNPQNPLIRFLVNESKIEESDMELPIDPSNYDRIAQAIDADAYCVIDANNYVQDVEKYTAFCTYNVKIIPIGTEEPIFEKSYRPKFAPVNGYWQKTTAYDCFKILTKKFVGSYTKNMGKFKGYKYKPVKEVENKYATSEE